MATTPRFVTNDVSGELAEAFKEMSRPVALAATKAVTLAGDNLKKKGRDSITSAGFSRRTANTWRLNIYPPRGQSIDAAAFCYWKLPYGSIFEEGGTIPGRPTLWLPMANLPLRIGRGKPTPKNLIGRGVKLFPLDIGGKTFLAANVRVPQNEKDQMVTSVTLSQLRQGSRAIGKRNRTGVTLKAVPLFHGLRSVTLRKRVNLGGIADQERKALPGYYDAALKV